MSGSGPRYHLWFPPRYLALWPLPARLIVGVGNYPRVLAFSTALGFAIHLFPQLSYTLPILAYDESNSNSRTRLDPIQHRIHLSLLATRVLYTVHSLSLHTRVLNLRDAFALDGKVILKQLSRSRPEPFCIVLLPRHQPSPTGTISFHVDRVDYPSTFAQLSRFWRTGSCPRCPATTSGLPCRISPPIEQPRVTYTRPTIPNYESPFSNIVFSYTYPVSSIFLSVETTCLPCAVWTKLGPNGYALRREPGISHRHSGHQPMSSRERKLSHYKSANSRRLDIGPHWPPPPISVLSIYILLNIHFRLFEVWEISLKPNHPELWIPQWVFILTCYNDDTISQCLVSSLALAETRANTIDVIEFCIAFFPLL